MATGEAQSFRARFGQLVAFAMARIALVAPDDRFVGALEDTDDASLSAAAVLDPLDADDNAVAVHPFVEERTRNVDVAAGLDRPLRRDESVAGRVRLQPTDVEVHLFGKSEAVTADLDELPGSDERFDVALERRAIVPRNFEEL